MKKVYLDNASTTFLRNEVIEEMIRVMQNSNGNPSSTHSFGRDAKAVIETSRKLIANILNCTAQEIIFTSGATEGINWIIKNAIKNLKIERIITSRTEHHAVLHSIEKVSNSAEVCYLNIDSNGSFDYQQLEELLKESKKTLVCLMYVNNETGVVSDIEKIGELCKKYNALYFSDTVQAVGKTNIDLSNWDVDFIVASAHKFNGPKGVGFIRIKKSVSLGSMIHGGEQEKGLRGGTEAVHQIAGLAKALEISHARLDEERVNVTKLKQYAIKAFRENFPGVEFNGGENSFYTILNIRLPFSADKAQIILFMLDIKGISVSRGSACQSGSVKPSHVLAEMLPESELEKPSIRISFSHSNTKEDIDSLIEALKTI